MDPNIFPGAATPQQDQPNSVEPIKPAFFSSQSEPIAPQSSPIASSPAPVPSPVSQPSSTPLPDFMLNRRVEEPEVYEDPKKRLKKLAIVAGIVLGVVLIGYAIFASIMHSKNSDDKILALMEENSETIYSVEGIFDNATSGYLEVQHLFNEQNHTLLNELSEKATNFASELKDIKPNYASSSISSDLSAVKKDFLILAPAFSKSVELYNEAYEGYINGDLSKLQETLAAENSKPEEERNELIIAVANRFIDYADEKATLSKNIRTYNCNVNAIPGYVPTYDLKSCDYLVYELNDINNSISESYPVIMRIFSAYTNYSIDEENSLTTKTNNIINALGGSIDEEPKE